MLNTDLKDQLVKEALRIEEDSLFSGKGHYNAVAPWVWFHRSLGIISAVGSALAGLAVLKQWSPTIPIVSAGISSVAAVVLTTLKPSEEADRHQRAGDSFFAVKNRARIFRSIELLVSTTAEDSVLQSIKSLSESLAEIRSGSPVIPRYAYEKALNDIEVENTAQYKVDKKDSSTR